MTTLPQHPLMKPEGSDAIADLVPVTKFTCGLCGFKFSKEEVLIHHLNFCKDVEDPIDMLDTGSITLNIAPSEEEIQNELLDKFASTEPRLDMKIEEVEFTETTVSGQSIDPPKVETAEEVFPSSKNVKYVKVCKAEKQKHSLKVHMRRHTEEKPLKCSLCDYACVRNSHFILHMRSHTGEKPFKCTSCDYACTIRSSLTVHMRTHTGERPFKCTICDYAAVQRGQLILHMRTHTGERPFRCTLCDYAAVRNSHLILHMRYHSGEKPFKCSLCDYACSVSSGLTDHMRSHTGEKPFKCTMCDYASTIHSNLARHIRRGSHHKQPAKPTQHQCNSNAT